MGDRLQVPLTQHLHHVTLPNVPSCVLTPAELMATTFACL